MTRTEAKRVLDRRREGQSMSAALVVAALYASGDWDAMVRRYAPRFDPRRDDDEPAYNPHPVPGDERFKFDAAGLAPASPWDALLVAAQVLPCELA